MLTTIIRALRWTDENLQNLPADLAANYARELLAAHGLVEIEIDHIRRNSAVQPAVVPLEAEKITPFFSPHEHPVSQTRLEVIRTERLVPGVSLRPPTPNCDLWSGPELVAALSVAGAAMIALLFCLAAIFKF